MKYNLGLVIGKFLPPHRGHKLLIDTATAQSRRVVVIVCAKPTDFVDGDTRADWMREIHPAVEIRVIDDRYDENDSQVWATNTLRWLGRAPDAVFTSEDYGDRYAALMGAEHVLVDKARTRVPISGTAVRADVFNNWDFIEPPVRGWMAKRVCVLGAESTGTTTLAEALAERLQTVWVEEYGREYAQKFHPLEPDNWQSEEFCQIAREQTRREDAAAREANRVLICDTNAFATALWHRRYLGTNHEELDGLASQARCDLYLLTGDEIPFVQDGLRDGETIRHEMQGWFVDALAAQAVPWFLVQGSRTERIEQALALIRECRREKG